MKVAKVDVIKSIGSLQVCARQNAGAEAVIPAIQGIINNEDTEAILFIDVNAFKIPSTALR